MKINISPLLVVRLCNFLQLIPICSLFLIQVFCIINLCNHSSPEALSNHDCQCYHLITVSPTLNNIHISQQEFGQKQGRKRGRLAKKSSWAFLLNQCSYFSSVLWPVLQLKLLYAHTCTMAKLSPKHM